MSLLDEYETAARASLKRMEDEPGGKSKGDSAALRAIAYSVFGIFQCLREGAKEHKAGENCQCVTCQYIRREAEVAAGMYR